ncbi:MAG: tetraacyldisaccharide 4'-kinase [bacterium]|nr:tetraacyldisaccharide 4'-kinase [Candidatus Kapabacteria bacterium]
MPLARFLQAALYPFSLLYQAASHVDGRKKQRRAFRASLSVISVGNISVGGTGKTQLVELLIRTIGKQHAVLVLSRGYGRENPTNELWTSSEALPDPERFGDEPAMLARSIRYGGLAVGRDRAELLRQFEQRFKGAVAILDDGFQHRQVARDIDIVIVDDATARPPHLLMPAGRLREPPQSLARADLIVATSPPARTFAESFIDHDRIFDARTVAGPLRRFRDRTAVDSAYCSVILITAIARPERVVESLREIGVQVIEHIRYRDHHRYVESDLSSILEAASRHPDALIATTAKDAVKLGRFDEIADQLVEIETTMHVADEERFLRVINTALAQRQQLKS